MAVDENISSQGQQENAISHNQNLRMLLRKIIFFAPGKIIPAFIMLAFTYIFTRVFNAAGFGKYSLIFSLSTFASALLSQWLQQAINRYLPAQSENENRKQTKEVIVSCLALIVLVVVIIAILIRIIFLFYPGSIWLSFLAPTVLLVLALSLFGPLTVILQAEMRAKEHSLFNLARGTLRLVIPLLLVFFIARRPENLILGTALSVLITIPLLWKRAGIPSPVVFLINEKKALIFAGIKKFAVYGFPMIGWFLSATLLNVGDRFVIQWFRGAAEVGIYSANYEIIYGAVNLATAPVLLAAHPFLMKSWGQGNKEQAVKWLGKIIKYFSLVGLILVSGIWLFCQDIAGLLLGEEFRQGCMVMPLVAAGVVVWQIGMYAHKPLEFNEKTNVMFWLSLGVVVLNFILNILFVPQYGYIAAAYTTLISYLTYAVLVGMAGRRLLL